LIHDPEIPKDAFSALNTLEDEALVRLLVFGHTEPMGVIFDRYHALLMRIALGIVRNRTDAEDIVQIAFTDFYRQIKIFDARKGSLRAWLVQYIYGRSLNRLRELRRRRFFDHIEFTDASPTELAASDGGAFDLNGAETRRLVEQAMQTLNGKGRAIIELVCFSGMTITEIAAMTGESHGTLQHRYYRSIEKLRAWIKKAENERSKVTAKGLTTKNVEKKLSRAVEIGPAEAKIG
jgi:RNA polymerase sigma-70 factor (ECF subfamily)